ncbi:F0F1 ATP synthase subunit A [Paraconexibacter algicola]|uniref:ATP synthase subunit a n=1 Tax=Paraconexibacter algicola TaxID=2133960 RepID=A0A2T4UMV0_9ACTN|nr:F0F1 ATP synthase subunit A [Paraconexibacter algicola]PTL60531.1 ATP synthase F0 subunit A [Paraconexibacter algicola]
MTTKAKVGIGLGIYVGVIVLFVAIFGFSRTDNDFFQPQEEFKLDTWFELGPLAFNKATMYVLVAAIFMCATMIYVARRMKQKPNRVQTLVELAYTTMRDNITKQNMDHSVAAKWFPFIAALFLFIWFSNMLGYIPLPTNTAHKVDIFGFDVPSFALYAATANLSIPLALSLLVWIIYNAVGIRTKGFGGYMRSFIPAGVPKAIVPMVFVLELMSNFMRLISLSVRLFANILAGHLIILFMGGALVVLLGIEALGIVTFPMAVGLFMFEVGLVATLQAFIFATLTAIYLGGATSDHH